MNRSGAQRLAFAIVMISMVVWLIGLFSIIFYVATYGLIFTPPGDEFLMVLVTISFLWAIVGFLSSIFPVITLIFQAKVYRGIRNGKPKRKMIKWILLAMVLSVFSFGLPSCVIALVMYIVILAMWKDE